MVYIVNNVWFKNEKAPFYSKFSLPILWTVIVLPYLPVHSPEMRKVHLLLLFQAKRNHGANQNDLMLCRNGRWSQPPNSHCNLWDHLVTSLFVPRERPSIMLHQEANNKHLASGTKKRAKYIIDQIFFILVDEKLVQWRKNKDLEMGIKYDL